MSAKTEPMPCPCIRKTPLVSEICGEWFVSCGNWRCDIQIVAEGKTRAAAIRNWNRKVRKARK